MSSSTNERRWLRCAVRGVLLAAVVATLCWAQDAPAAAPAADPPEATEAAADDTVALETQTVVTPEAQAVLDRMTASLNALQAFDVSAEVSRDEVLHFGYKLQNTEHARMRVQRPNRLRAEVSGDIKQRIYTYDGTQMIVYAPDKDVYSSQPAPSTLGELIGTMLDAGIEMPLVDMLYNGAAGNLTEAVRVGLVAGESQVNGVATDHLAFRQADLDWQLWVEKGPRALPVKMVITTRYAVGDPQYQATLTWNTSPKFDAKTFVFTPPASAIKVPSRTKLVAEEGGAQ